MQNMILNPFLDNRPPIGKIAKMLAYQLKDNIHLIKCLPMHYSLHMKLHEFNNDNKNVDEIFLKPSLLFDFDMPLECYWQMIVNLDMIMKRVYSQELYKDRTLKYGISFVRMVGTEKLYMREMVREDH